MLLDSFTIIAQIINFLILIYLLKRFLFNRIIQIMDEREKQITDQMQDAKTAKEAAQKELDEQQRIREELQEKWNEMLAEAKKDAQKKREELVKDARSKIDEEQKIGERRYPNNGLLFSGTSAIYPASRCVR